MYNVSRQNLDTTKTCSMFHVLCQEKRAYFPLFIKASLLPINFLYHKISSDLMHDVRNASASRNICNLFMNTSCIHLNNVNIKQWRLEVQKNAFSRVGAKLRSYMTCSLRELPKSSVKKGIILLSIFDDKIHLLACTKWFVD